MRHRSYLDIIAVILNAANERRGIGKSRLMYNTFLGYARLKEYLPALTEMGLLHYDRDAQTFKLIKQVLVFS
jgi:predicted transcriptional regulator